MRSYTVHLVYERFRTFTNPVKMIRQTNYLTTEGEYTTFAYKCIK